MFESAELNHDISKAVYRREEPKLRQALLEAHDDARFYDNKVKTARFFVSHLLPQNAAIAAGIESGDGSALEMNF